MNTAERLPWLNIAMKILLVEDDLDLGNGVRIALSDQGMDVLWVRTVAQATQALDADCCDLMLLDLGLPDGDGEQLLDRLRARKVALPVLILSARDALVDRVRGLDSGADDYLVKPFALAELLSRVRALARRSYGLEENTLAVRGLRLNTQTRRVSVADRPLELTGSEYALLKCLMMRADRVLTRRVLEEQTLPGNQTNTSNSLDVHMANLRRKIGDGYIRTVRGVGYVIDSTTNGGAE
jgi:two-component system response regulator QseB